MSSCDGCDPGSDVEPEDVAVATERRVSTRITDHFKPSDLGNPVQEAKEAHIAMLYKANRMKRRPEEARKLVEREEAAERHRNDAKTRPFNTDVSGNTLVNKP